MALNSSFSSSSPSFFSITTAPFHSLLPPPPPCVPLLSLYVALRVPFSSFFSFFLFSHALRHSEESPLDSSPLCIACLTWCIWQSYLRYWSRCYRSSWWRSQPLLHMPYLMTKKVKH